MPLATDAVTELLREVAASSIRPRFRALEEGQVIEKEPGDLVTVADREAEALIRKALRAGDPGSLVVGEEDAFSSPGIIDGLATAERAWVVDPIDGTRNFIGGNEHYAVMAAELFRGDVVRAWILHPESDEAYVAERGAGVFCDGVRIEPRDRALPYVGSSSRSRFIGKVGPGVQRIKPTQWCCGFDYTHLLDGRRDFTIYHNGRPWDHLPGLLMLEEVGGSVRTADGRRIGMGMNGPGLLAFASEAVWEGVSRVWADLRA